MHPYFRHLYFHVALQVEQYANKTHHYADVFTEQTLAPLGELAYVRLDENTAEKVRHFNTHNILFQFVV